MPNRFLPMLFPIGILVLLALVAGLFQFNGLYGQDSHEYLRYARELRSTLSGGSDPDPFFWPVYYPLAGALLGFVLSDVLLALQIVSMISLAGSAFFLARSIQLLFTAPWRMAALVTGLVFILAPFVFRTGLVVMSEMLAIFFITGSIFFGLKYRARKNLVYLLLFSACCVGATFTRYNAILVIAPFVVFIAMGLIRKARYIPILAATLVAVLCALPQWLLHTPMADSGLQHDLLNSWSLTNFFQNTFYTADGRLSYPLPNILYAFTYLIHPGFTILAIPFLFFLRQRHLTIPVLTIISGIVLYTIFIMGIPTQNDRLLIPVFPLVVLCCYPGFAQVSKWIQKIQWLPFVSITLFILVQGVLIYRAMKPFVQLNQFEKKLANELHLPNSSLPLYTFSVDGALRSYGVENPIENLWYDDMPIPDSTAYVLFNESQFRQQWEGKSVMLNWQRLGASGELEVLDTFPHGWMLYHYTQRATL